MNTESTGDNKGFIEWTNKLEKMSDMEISYELHDRIMNHSDIDKESLVLFDAAYTYCMKLIEQGKPLEKNLLKIYLEDVKHYDINQIDIVNLFLLLGICGICFNKIE